MLLRMIGLVSAVLAAAVSIFAGAFEDFGRLWILPVSFAGCFLAGVIGAFLFLVIAAYRVDTSKEQDRDDPFYRRLIALYVEAIIMLARVRVHTEGLEKTPKESRFLLVCNHLFVADPGIIIHHFRDSQLAFISKTENRDLFVVGKVMHKILCQTIDRDNDRQALQTILACIRIIREDKASIAVFPEGYTAKDGKLHRFRPGVFKIAQKAGVPIVVCTLRNTRPILHNMVRLKSTDVQLHLVDVIPATELKGKTAVEISDRVHRMMAEDLGPGLVADD